VNARTVEGRQAILLTLSGPRGVNVGWLTASKWGYVGKEGGGWGG